MDATTLKKEHDNIGLRSYWDIFLVFAFLHLLFALTLTFFSLQKMMKDQFGNYVVQKIFDMGNDKQMDIVVKCIQVHLSALKKFPYAKHIVARYEQLSGEVPLSTTSMFSLKHPQLPANHVMIITNQICLSHALLLSPSIWGHITKTLQTSTSLLSNIWSS